MFKVNNKNNCFLQHIFRTYFTPFVVFLLFTLNKYISADFGLRSFWNKCMKTLKINVQVQHILRNHHKIPNFVICAQSNSDFVNTSILLLVDHFEGWEFSLFTLIHS